MSKEFEKKGQDYQAQEKTMTDAVKEVKMKELQDLQNRIESTNQSAQDKVAKKKEELYSPILDKADKAIKEVAKEKGYDYIFDASAGMLLYAKEGDNILALVKAKLGIK
jgi:outer membrane protein